jgi:F-type H+-transporting ATPase subunit b
MLEFHANWFLLLLVNFLFLVWILNKILFKPLVKVFGERDQAISGSLEEARDMEIERETALDNLRREFANASGKAKQEFEALRQAGLDKQKDLLTAAQGEATGILEKARAELHAEAEKARTALRADVQRFSDEIVSKLVGA